MIDAAGVGFGVALVGTAAGSYYDLCHERKIPVMLLVVMLVIGSLLLYLRAAPFPMLMLPNVALIAILAWFGKCGGADAPLLLALCGLVPESILLVSLGAFVLALPAVLAKKTIPFFPFVLVSLVCTKILLEFLIIS